MATIKPTHKDPISPQSVKFEKDFKKTMIKTNAPAIRESNLNEVNSMLSEVEQSLKKKIFSLAKMESLVFSDPKLSAVYEEMSENGEEKYGYHYNETIQNMIFNDYVLNSPKYLQKYKMAIPKEKKRRDKSGINQLKKQGEKKMSQSGLAKLEPTENESVIGEEIDSNQTKVVFLVNTRDPKDPDLFAYFPEEIHNGEYRTAYSHIGQHSAAHPDYAKESRQASPEEYADLKAELEGIGYNLDVLNGMQESTSAGSAGGAAGYVGYAGPAAFSSKGDLSGDFKGKKKKKKVDPKAKPISTGFALAETIGNKSSNYLIDPSGFEVMFNELTESSSISQGDGSGYYDTPLGFKDDIKNVTKQLDTDKELKDLDTVRISLPGQEKRAYGKHLPSGKNVSSAIAKPSPNKEVKKPFYKGGKVVSPFKTGNENISGTVLAKHSQPERLQEEAKSKSQQQLMGMAYAYKKGELDGEASDTIKKIAAGMSEKDLEDFASTKHKGLPDHVDENLGQPDVEYLVKMYSIANSGPNYDPQKTERFRNNIPLMDNQQIQKVYQTLEGIMRQMGHKPENMMNQPEMVNEFLSLHDTVEYVSDRSGENEFEMGGDRWQFVNAKYPNGKIDIGVYKFGHDLVYDYARWREEFNINENNIKEDMQTMIQNNGTSMSNKSQATGDMSSEVPMGAQQTSGLNESDIKLLEEINNELEAFSIHHDKLKIMAEDKKTPSMIQGDRLRSENPKNFKKDLQHSGTKEIIDVEKELQWKDQQTDVPKDPQKLGMDIEKQEIETADMEGDEALKNVGDSTNKDGDQIPKRNLTTKEQEEVNLYRNGQHSLNYDNEPADRFVDRMEADQGEFFEMGEKQKKFKKDAPMYDKDSQPIDDGIEKVQFDKNVKKKGDKVAWNERMGLGSNVKLAESMITGRYIDILGKRRLIEFRLNEVKEVEKIDEAMKLSFAGLGNTYMSKTVDKKVVVNEGVVSTINRDKFYTDGKQVFVVQTPAQNLNEGKVKEEKPVMNEQMDKMKHLLGYKPEAYIDTKNVKKNRKF